MRFLAIAALCAVLTACAHEPTPIITGPAPDNATCVSTPGQLPSC